MQHGDITMAKSRRESKRSTRKNQPHDPVLDTHVGECSALTTDASRMELGDYGPGLGAAGKSPARAPFAIPKVNISNGHLARQKGLYETSVVGDEMAPRYYHDESVIVIPAWEPAPSPSPDRSYGDFVVVELFPDGKDTASKIYFGQLTRCVETVEITQLNPPKTISWPRESVAVVHRIVPDLDELFGIVAILRATEEQCREGRPRVVPGEPAVYF
jgi:hypothetical protein